MIAWATNPNRSGTTWAYFPGGISLKWRWDPKGCRIIIDFWKGHRHWVLQLLHFEVATHWSWLEQLENAMNRLDILDTFMWKWYLSIYIYYTCTTYMRCFEHRSPETARWAASGLALGWAQPQRGGAASEMSWIWNHMWKLKWNGLNWLNMVDFMLNSC